MLKTGGRSCTWRRFEGGRGEVNISPGDDNCFCLIVFANIFPADKGRLVYPAKTM